MSSFLYSSAAARVVPEGLSPPPSRVPVTHINKKAMDPPTSPDLVTEPHEHKPSDDLIKPTLDTFDQKIRVNPGLISPRAGGDSPSPNSVAGDRTDEESCDRAMHRAPAISEGWLWPKYAEYDEAPPSPLVEQMSRERLHTPSLSKDGGSEGTQAMRVPEPAYKLDTEPAGINHPSTLSYRNPSSPAWAVQTSGESESQASAKPKEQTALEAAPLEASRRPVDEADKLSGGMKQSCKNSARGKLARVVEESESFSRREFGEDGLLYMSTHSSANHASNYALHSSYNHSNLTLKLSSYHPNVSLRTHRSYPPNNFTNCKSAPAGSAARTRSTFAMFRRGSSEGGKLGGRVAYQTHQKWKKPRSLSHTLLWPLVKIRNGYVGCMMGFVGTGDLSGMAQGGSYATRAQYFDDIPLSKIDSRNHG